MQELRAVDQQGLSWGALFAQHNEHRLVLPRLIFLVDRLLVRQTDLISYPAVIFIQFSHSLILLCFYRKASDSCEAPLLKLATSIAAAALTFILMFSLVQAESLAWGFQVGFVGVYAAFSCSVLFYLKAASAPRRTVAASWLLASMLAFVLAALSLSNGLLCGFILLLIGVLAGVPRWVQIVTAGVTAVLLTAYLHDFHFVPYHPPITRVFKDPISYGTYLLIFLGSPWRTLGVGPSALLGALGALSTTLALVYEFVTRDRNHGRLALLGVMVFIVSTAAVIAAGRFGFGLQQALESRYATPAGIFWVAQVLYWISRAVDSRYSFLLPSSLVASLALVIGVVSGEFDGEKWLRQRTANIDLASNALLSDVPDPALLKRICWDPELVISEAKYLREKRLSVFASKEASWLGDKLMDHVKMAEPERCHGAVDRIDALQNVPGRAVAVSGWAWDAKAAALVRQVVLADAELRVSGFASGFATHRAFLSSGRTPSRKKLEWRGFAQVNSGQNLHAFGILRDGRACDLGSNKVP